MTKRLTNGAKKYCAINKRSIVKLLSFIVCVCLFLSCNSSKPRKRDKEREYKKLYSQADKEFTASVFLYHNSDEQSQLYFAFDNSQLLFKKPDTARYFLSTVKIHYRFLAEAGSKNIIDSSTVTIYDTYDSVFTQKKINGYIPMRTINRQVTFMEIYFDEVNGKRRHLHYLKCDKQTSFSQQNYILLGPAGRIYFSNKIETGNEITINNSRVAFNKAQVNFFANDYTLPPPPFSQREPAPYPAIADSSFTQQSYDGHSVPLAVKRKGIYFVRVDSAMNGNEGCAVFGVEQNFPKVLTHDNMIAATRYILGKEEYANMMNATDKRKAIDHFWLTVSGSEARGRELIKRYYNRVEDANVFFSSHIEGWKTDMGMIYIVFGPPNKTYKTAQMESWEYNLQGSAQPLLFRFEKINNPFSDNSYKLIRSEAYKNPWYFAVNNWRDGHVYLDTK